MKNNSKPIVLVVIGILIGGYSMLPGVGTAALPLTLKFISSAYYRHSLSRIARRPDLSPQQQEAAQQFLNGILKMVDEAPPSFFPLCLWLGLAGVAVSVFYIVAFASLLTSKEWRFTAFYTAMVVSITYCVMRWALSIQLEDPYSYMLSSRPYVRIALDLVFLIIVERWVEIIPAPSANGTGHTAVSNEGEIG